MWWECTTRNRKGVGIYILNNFSEEYKNKPELFMRVPEAAEYAHFSKQTIRNWIVDFNVGMKIAGRWFIKKDLLDKILSHEISYENQGRPRGVLYEKS